MDNIIENLAEQIRQKSVTQTQAKNNTRQVFNDLKDKAFELVKSMKEKLGDQAKDAKLEFDKVSEYEFHLMFAGELLIFTTHSNILNFAEGHILHKSPYIKQNTERGYFGAIMAYNFLSDSLKFKRMFDQGYLIARLFVNNENHFYVEGVNMNYEYTDVAKNIVDDSFLEKFLKSTLEAALETDPVMSNFEQEKSISVADKLNRSMLGNVKKIGFQMKTDK